MSAPMRLDPDDSSAANPDSSTQATTSNSGSLYRKYRPQSFDDRDLVGQDHVVRTLRNAIRLDRVAHAYLFCGPRGTGKTTTARLLAKAVNCLDPDPNRRPCNACTHCLAVAKGATSDVVEIDAASNRGIDDIRDLRERVTYAPTQLRVKFYIVDEAHQITGAAANAFLKTLEEPPVHTKFVLATTDPEELLPTIVSRCQRFDFRRVSGAATIRRLRMVAEQEGIAISDDALAEIARHATGSLRDALGLLDQLALYEGDGRSSPAAGTPINAQDVRAMLGLSRNERIELLVEAIAGADPRSALDAVNEAVDAGEDPRQLNRQLVSYLRQLLFFRAGSDGGIDAIGQALAARFDLRELAELTRHFGEVDYRIKHAPYGHLPLEIALVEATNRSPHLAPAAADPRTRTGLIGPVGPDVETSGPSSTPQSEADSADADDLRRNGRPTTALRDRVRGTPSPPPPAAHHTSERSTPASRPPGHGAPQEPEPPHGPPQSPVPGLHVEQIVDLWPRIRQDVKALNRRIEALLLSVDPALVAGTAVTLSTPYPFHRDKLNSDDVRQVVETAISRIVGLPVQVTTELREDVVRRSEQNAPTTGNGGSAPIAPAASATPTTAPDRPTADDVGAQRVRAAMNIFDAEEID